MPIDDDVHVVNVDTLVDPIDDRIDSSCKINLCLSSVESIMLDNSTSSYGNCVDQLVYETSPLLDDMCNVIGEPHVSDEIENVGPQNGIDPLSLSFSEDPNIFLDHRDNHVLKTSLILDNGLL